MRKALTTMSIRFAALALLASTIALGGCGGGDYLPPPRKSVASDEEEVAAPVVEAAKSSTAAAPASGTKPPEQEKMIAGVGRNLVANDNPDGAKPRTAAPRKSADDAEKKPEIPARSADMRQWTADDFRNAKLERDPRLTKAVIDWSAAHVNDEAAGQLIVELLENTAAMQTATVTDEDGYPIGGSPDRRANPQFAEACVAALGANGSAAARKGLQRALLGKLPTDLTDKRLVEAVLKTLAANRQPKHEEILLTVLTKSEKVRPSLIGELDANGIQEECLKHVKNQSSASFRRSVAVELASPGIAGPLRNRLVAWLLTNDFVNLPAQSVMYVGASCDLDTRRKLEKIFAPYAKDACLESIGRGGNAASGAAALSERSTQIVAALYDPAFTKTLAERVRAVDNLDTERELLALAMAMPVSEVRRETASLLKRRWSTGVKAWEKAQADGSRMLDPGLLLAVKAVPREDALAHKSLLGDKAEKPKLAKSDNPEVQRFQAEKQAKEEWMIATEKLVKAINERMRAASQGALSGASSATNTVVDDCRQATSASDVDTTDQPSGSLPLKLSGAARVISEFHLDWPRQWPHPEKNSQQPDLVVHYVRMEQEERVSTVQGFYRRQLKNAESRYIKQGNWLESVERLTEQGRLRSVDVTITRPTDTPPRDRTAKEPLVIEILWIEAPDCTR